MVLVLLFSALRPSSFAIVLMGKIESWLLYLNCRPVTSVYTVDLPHGAVRWSVVCSCGFSLSYIHLLFFSLL